MGLRDRFRAWLAHDGDAEPQARDERPIATSRTEHTEEPDAEDIEAWTTEYYANPLIRQPVRNFAADVLEPGVTPQVEVPDDGTMPTVTDDYPIAAYRGLELDDALAKWVNEAGIANGGQFNRPLSDLLEDVVKDLRGRRGSALIEHAYDDPTERQYILGLRLFKPETATAYTREGKAILLRPDDDPAGAGFDTVAIQDIGADPSRGGAPDTPAEQTAAFVQYDDIFGRFNEREDIPFALDDVTFFSNDPDTGAIFGTPDSASVIDEAKGLRNEWDEVIGALRSTAYGNWVVQVGTDDEDEAQSLVDGLDPTDKDKSIHVTNYDAEADQVFGDFPDITSTVQQQIEYILTAMPTPLYRVGFAGDINRDITTEQREDYREEVSRERDRLEAALQGLIEQKAREFLFNDAKAGQDLDVVVGVEIRPDESDSPLEDEAFSADEFASLMQGMSAAVGTGGARQVVPIHELRETLLGLDPEPPEPPEDDVDAAAALPDETDPEVREAFNDAYLGTRYTEGDPVVQAGGTRGIVTEVRTDPFEFKGREHDASESSPAYVIATENGSRVVRASELKKEDWTGDVGPENPEQDIQEAEASVPEGVTRQAILSRTSADLGHGSWSMPESWRESETPARLILLKAWAGMNGQFDCGGDCCVGEMRGNVATPNQFCAAMKDEVLGTHSWR